jgi:hypothetical protein
MRHMTKHVLYTPGGTTYGMVSASCVCAVLPPSIKHAVHAQCNANCDSLQNATNCSHAMFYTSRYTYASRSFTSKQSFLSVLYLNPQYGVGVWPGMWVKDVEDISSWKNKNKKHAEDANIDQFSNITFKSSLIWNQLDNPNEHFKVLLHTGMAICSSKTFPQIWWTSLLLGRIHYRFSADITLISEAAYWTHLE